MKTINQNPLRVLLFLSVTFNFYAQVNVKLDLNVKHSVGGISTFERWKFITTHANQSEGEWNGDNVLPDLKNDFLNGRDVYLGRDTGGITYNLNQVKEDPTRPGFADPADITSKGTASKNSFAANTSLHPYESRKNWIICAQLHPFWTGAEQKATGKGWKLANATATGEYMGRYITAFHGGNGQKLPSFVEVINEPDYDLLGGLKEYTKSINEIAVFHNDVAAAIRAQIPNIRIGGYTNAFPEFEVGNFQRWINRDKMFMDVAGANMDFWSIHLYDFPSINGGKKQLRSGSNIEATFDMMDQYSMMKFNKTKPYVISEYGAQTHDYNNSQWSSYRDWLILKGMNSQLMSFLERPNTIDIAIPFVITKAEWGFNATTGVPYTHRLMRKTNEPASYTGQWTYTDLVKFYDLWKNVKGTRVYIKPDNLDVLANAYIDGNKGYVILNNLNFQPTTVNLNLFDTNNIVITSINKKHLTVINNNATLEESLVSLPLTSVTLGAESTIILEYTFANAIAINETADETKYFATTYLQPIVANQPVVFQVNNVQKSTYGDAVLRIGLGRDHGQSLSPIVKVNNTSITVPINFRGYNQAQRERFFGVLEIPVPYSLLTTNNQISVQLPDSGGHISSVALQVFNFSKNILSVASNTFQDDKKITVYPNPVDEEILIQSSSENILNATAMIYSVSGQLVQESMVDTNGKINVSKLPKGLYGIRLTKGNKKIGTAKFSKK
ncbi:T9SS type A sorting domain-containing protein [Flavobacterium sp. NG2]|uniref:T9SS type A sorting domain-containing protein n=1 Tax=Flavobacterium sp. NG2 TaxID=3097547 RepID=UPI002A7ECD21|nr:T9SS type A sorting domain-containing protein [Flavobacterium sp. NG2]WPR72173.1 T9SS type A sorting domain-containing protein [Flavobacterium sp. NG2]